MAVIVLPIDADAGTGLPTYSAQQTREAFAAFLGWAPTGRPLGANSGVRAGTPLSTVTASSTTWAVAAHAGVVDAESAALAGPYLYACDGSDSGSVTAADVSNPRVDIVYVTINDTVQDGSGLRGGVVGYLAGTPAGSPTAPATPARSLRLATIAVPVSGGGSPTVTFVAPAYDRTPFCQLNKTNSQAIPDTTNVQVTYQASDSSTSLSSMADVANNQIICKVAGMYSIVAAFPWDGSAGGGREMKIQVNAVDVMLQKSLPTATAWAGAGGDPKTVATQTRLAVGDEVTAVVSQNSGGSVPLDATGAILGFLSVCRIGS